MPATFANSVGIIPTHDGMARLVFGMSVDGEFHLHLAVAMPIASLVALRDALILAVPGMTDALPGERPVAN